MPGIDGLELCPRSKTSAPSAGGLVVIISASHIPIANRGIGLTAGADGSVLRPIPHRAHPTWVEPFARIGHLTRELRARKAEPAATLAKVPPLRGRRPICAGCKQIRATKNYWNQIEVYVAQHPDAISPTALVPIALKNISPILANTRPPHSDDPGPLNPRRRPRPPPTPYDSQQSSRGEYFGGG